MATEVDVIKLALRDCQVAGEGEQATAEQHDFCSSVLSSIFAELGGEAYPQFTLATIGDQFKWPLALYLSAQVAPAYNAKASTTRASAKLRLMALINPDMRTDDARDLDYV